MKPVTYRVLVDEPYCLAVENQTATLNFDRLIWEVMLELMFKNDHRVSILILDVEKTRGVALGELPLIKKYLRFVAEDELVVSKVIRQYESSDPEILYPLYKLKKKLPTTPEL
jgi:hypothetical protein